MEAVSLIFIAIILIVFASIPCLLYWLLLQKLLPKTLTLPPYPMTGLCILLAFLAGMDLNPELEMGILSIASNMLVLTLLWALVLLPIGVLTKYWKLHA